MFSSPAVPYVTNIRLMANFATPPQRRRASGLAIHHRCISPLEVLYFGQCTKHPNAMPKTANRLFLLFGFFYDLRVVAQDYTDFCKSRQFGTYDVTSRTTLFQFRYHLDNMFLPGDSNCILRYRGFNSLTTWSFSLSLPRRQGVHYGDPFILCSNVYTISNIPRPRIAAPGPT